MLDLFGEETSPVAPERSRVTNLRPFYKDLVLRVPPRCDDCVLRLHREWNTGTDFVPARAARVERRQGDSLMRLCRECAEQRKAQDGYPRSN